MKYLHNIASGQSQQPGMMQKSRILNFCLIRKKCHQEHPVHSSVRGYNSVRVTGLVTKTKMLWKLFYSYSETTSETPLSLSIVSLPSRSLHRIFLVSRIQTYSPIPPSFHLQLTCSLIHLERWE